VKFVLCNIHEDKFHVSFCASDHVIQSLAAEVSTATEQSGSESKENICKSWLVWQVVYKILTVGRLY
jgi:hypothetical protein